jgi:hypothetical protein
MLLSVIDNLLVNVLPTWLEFNVSYDFLRELHFQDLEREKAARAELEKTSSRESPKIPLPDQTSMHFICL